MPIKNDMVSNDPFCPARLSRFMNGDRATDKVFIELQDEEGNWKDPSGAAIVHGESYQLVTNQNMHNMVDSVCRELRERESMEFIPIPGDNLLWNGKAYIERWYAPEIKFETPQGSKVMLGIEARNSYDRSSKAQLGFYAMHLACQNQFHSTNLFGEPFSVRHVATDGNLLDNIDDAMDRVLDEAKNFGSIIPKLKMLNDFRITDTKDYFGFLDKCEKETGLVINDKKIREELSGEGSTKKKGIVVDYSMYGEKDSLWSLVNAYTAITTHDTPGLGGADKAARFIDFAIREAENALSKKGLLV